MSDALPGKRPSRAVCMPVGPAGIRSDTAQMLIGLVKAGIVDAVFCHESHVIPARNACWESAIRYGLARVLWLDSDIFAPLWPLRDFLDRADDRFAAEKDVAWIGAVCKRRGGGLAMLPGDDGGEQYPLLMGLGIAYWAVDRMRLAIGSENAFSWVPPFGEDYRACMRVWDADLRVVVDRTLPTTHIDIGTWEGGENA